MKKGALATLRRRCRLSGKDRQEVEDRLELLQQAIRTQRGRIAKVDWSDEEFTGGVFALVLYQIPLGANMRGVPAAPRL